MAAIAVMTIPDLLGSDQWERGLALVSEERRRGIDRYLQPMDKARSLFGELLVRATVVRCTGVPNGRIRLQRTAYGKPYAAEPSGIGFNVSHSGSKVALIWGAGDEQLGIDVEAVRPIEWSIAERVFSERENSDLLDRPSAERLEYFYRLWTLKESVVKADGRGLSIPLDSFSIFEASADLWAISGAETCELQSVRLDGGYMLGACSRGSSLPVCIQEVKPIELFETLCG